MAQRWGTTPDELFNRRPAEVSFNDAVYEAAMEMESEIAQVRAGAGSPGEAAAAMRVYQRSLRMRLESERDGDVH